MKKPLSRLKRRILLKWTLKEQDLRVCGLDSSAGDMEHVNTVVKLRVP
jgi:hypothetical protein